MTFWISIIKQIPDIRTCISKGNILVGLIFCTGRLAIINHECFGDNQALTLMKFVPRP